MMIFTDFVLNGEPNGEVAAHLSNLRFDAGLMRPYVDRAGHQCVTVNTGRTRFDEKAGILVPIREKMLVRDAVDRGILPVANATTLIRKDEWLAMDRAVLSAARERLRAWPDLAATSTFSVPGMTKKILEHERMTDVGEAVVSMDGIREGQADRPLFQLEGLPLPITHVDFWFSKRDLATSRSTGGGLDLTMAEMAGRRVAEKIEDTLIGVTTGETYGNQSERGYANTPTVRGYTNHPDRITKTDLTTATGVSTSDSTVADVLAMIDLAKAQNFFGPYMLYTTNDWDQFMDGDYLQGAIAQGLAAPTQTLRSRIRAIDDIRDVRRLDRWTDTNALVLVQMTSEVVRAVNGMDITTVQWESRGGMQLNFKVMAIHVPQIRSQFIGTSQAEADVKTGIVHATTS